MDFNRCYGCMKPKTEGTVCENCGYSSDSANALHQLPVGTVLQDQYVIGKVLGQGGFGITYLGWDQYLDIPVAIKEYYPSGMVMRESTISLNVADCGADDGTRFRNNRERFLREAKVLARFSQEKEIVQIRNFFLANNTAYIVMEYVEGITLKQYVQNNGGKLSVAETLKILAPMIDALSKVHQAGLVHRDISPDNIMMLPGGGAKLLDFGAVRDVKTAAVDRELTKSTEAILKQGYAPIEQYQKRGSLGPWTDVYALCATIYFCLTGEAPADAPERLLMEEELELETKVPDLTAAQRAALEHGLALRADHRTGSMQQLLEELNKKEEQKPLPEEVPEEKKAAPEKEEKPRAAKPAKKKAETKEKAKAQEPPAASEPKQEKEAPQPKEKPRKKKTKKGGILALLLLAILVGGWMLYASMSGDEEISVPFVDYSVSGSCGSSATWKLYQNSGRLVISGSGAMTRYRPDWMEQGSLEVAPWQKYAENITAIEITGAITTIGSYSFTGLENLESVTICPSVRKIHDGAFQNSGVKTVIFSTEEEILSQLIGIGENAFRGTRLKDVVLPDGLVDIGSGAFADCPELQTVTLGELATPCFDLTKDGVFANCSEGLTVYGCLNSAASEYAELMGLSFNKTKSMTWDLVGKCGKDLYYYVDKDTGILSIKGTGAMTDYKHPEDTSWNNREVVPWSKYQDQIQILVLGEGVTELGEFAFTFMHKLKYICWPETTLKVIAHQAFLDVAIETITLPESVTEIEDFAFNWCYNLTELRLPYELKNLKEDALAECRKLKRVWIGWQTKINDWSGSPFSCGDEGAATTYRNLTIYGLHGSDAERFAEKYGYDFAVAAKGYAAEEEGQCGDKAYWFRDGETLVLYGDGATWKYNLPTDDAKGALAWEVKAGKAFIQAPEFRKSRDLIHHLLVMPGLDELSSGLLQGLNNLKSIDLGTISKCNTLFSHRSSLVEVTLPETLKTLPAMAFENCRNLERVTFLGPTVVEDQAFCGCESLREIVFQSGREQIRGTMFGTEETGNADALQKLTIYARKYSAAETYANRYHIACEIIE